MSDQTQTNQPRKRFITGRRFRQRTIRRRQICPTGFNLARG